MIIAPSLLAANSSCYGEEIKSVEENGAKYLHIDVMDGHFVPNLSFGPDIIKGLRNKSKLYFDTHLMIENPENYVEAFIKAGSNCITVHFEATDKLSDIYEICKKHRVGFGIALRPETQIKVIMPYIKVLNILLIMAVNPGHGGQTFMENAPVRILQAQNLRDKCSADFLISVDGGINVVTAKKCMKANADILVAGTSIFGLRDRGAAISKLIT